MSHVRNRPYQTLQYRLGDWTPYQTNVIREQAVSLTVNNETWLTFMCTPTSVEALAIGFLYNEEIIQCVGDVASVRVCPGGDNVDVWLNVPVKKPERWIRTSGCSGGETSIHKGSQSTSLPGKRNGKLLPPERVGILLRQLGAAQDLYRITGGVHTSALSDGETVVITAEDIGRHNTLDKLAGRYLLENILLSTKVILTTGRISSEMVQKAHRMGARVVISRTSPSSLSVEMAEGNGITLIGYARQEQFTVYTHPERLLQADVTEVEKVRQHDE
jgi:FdhD protein